METSQGHNPPLTNSLSFWYWAHLHLVFFFWWQYPFCRAVGAWVWVWLLPPHPTRPGIVRERRKPRTLLLFSRLASVKDRRDDRRILLSSLSGGGDGDQALSNTEPLSRNYPPPSKQQEAWRPGGAFPSFSFLKGLAQYGKDACPALNGTWAEADVHPHRGFFLSKRLSSRAQRRPLPEEGQ